MGFGCKYGNERLSRALRDQGETRESHGIPIFTYVDLLKCDDFRRDPAPRSVSLDDGQDQMRGGCGIMVDTVDGLHEILLGLRLNGSPRVGIAIKTREVGAGDLQADAVPCLEQVRGGPQVQA